MKKRPKGTAGMCKYVRTKVAKAGGKAVSSKPGHMADIGAKGGNLILARRGAEWFSVMGKLGGKISRPKCPKCKRPFIKAKP